MAEAPTGTGLDPSELARLATMQLRAKVIVEGAFAGLHHNVHPGSAIEFAEHKEYAPGDEIRRIDWKAVGRQDRYFVKRYEDETEMRTFLVVDASASMGYAGEGRVSKLVWASYVAGALAYLLAQQGDPAGLLVFDERTRRYLPPSTRPGHVRDLLRLLEDAAPAGRTDAAQALGHLGELAERRSLIVLFSDLLDAEGDEPPLASKQGDPRARGELAERLAQLRSRGHDVVLFHTLDRDEIDLPFEDLTHFEAMEPHDARTLLADPDDLREAFQRESRAFRERWRKACLESRVEYRFVTTGDRPAEILRAFLGERRGGTRRRAF